MKKEHIIRRNRYWWFAIFFLAAIGFISLGIIYYSYETQRITNDKYENIYAIAKLKTDFIQDWRKQRLADVRRVPGPLVRREMARLIKDPTNRSASTALQTQLHINRKTNIYAEALFLDIRGNILLAAPPSPDPVNPATIKAIGAALKNRKECLSDFFRNPKGIIYIDAVAPIPDNEGRPIALAVLRSKAADSLYPSIQSWPLPSKTAETLLVCREGNYVLYLNELRQRPNAALTLRFPITDSYLTSVKAVLGNYGRILGRDYRGAEVLAVAQPVAGSSWSILAKIDKREVLTEVKYRAWVVSIVVSLLILITAISIASIHRKRREEARRTAEARLRASEERHRTILQTAMDGILRVNLQGDIVDVNDSYCRMSGYVRPELLTMNLADLEAVETPHDTAAHIQKIVAQGDDRFESRHRHKNGSIFDIEVSVHYLPGDGGQIVSFLRDITERKKVNDTLRGSELRLNEAQRVAHIGNWELNLLTGNLIWSDELYRIFEIDPKNFGASYDAFLEAIHPEDREAVNKAYTNSLQARKPYGVTHRLLMPDGRIKYIQEQCETYYTSDGEPIRSVGTAQDVTEFKRSEEERLSLQERLKRSEKMEALGALAGGVAHDLNNVLGVLMGYAEMLAEKFPEGDDLRLYIDRILDSAAKGASIVQDLLTMARRSANITNVLNLNDIIAKLMDGLEFENIRTNHPQLIFRKELDKNLFNIKGSPIHLENTVMNLLLNAAEAVADRGQVIIRTENCYVDNTIHGYDSINKGEYVVLTVSDSGSGILPDDMGKIFEPFYTNKAMGRSGTGLGLAIVLGTVKDHGAYIDVQSELGKGTTFKLYFSITREAADKDAQQSGLKPYQGCGELILVVDDVQEQREMATLMLTGLGYRVNSVASGEEAIKYLKNNNVDLLLLDMIMPLGMDGLETYRQVREINPHQKTVIVSGFSDNSRVREAQRLGAGAYVKKPYLQEKIGLAIRHELDRA